jgi:hypothetical protein
MLAARHDFAATEFCILREGDKPVYFINGNALDLAWNMPKPRLRPIRAQRLIHAVVTG